jgi:hypothetical protein
VKHSNNSIYAPNEEIAEYLIKYEMTVKLSVHQVASQRKTRIQHHISQKGINQHVQPTPRNKAHKRILNAPNAPE